MDDPTSRGPRWPGSPPLVGLEPWSCLGISLLQIERGTQPPGDAEFATAVTATIATHAGENSGELPLSSNSASSREVTGNSPEFSPAWVAIVAVTAVANSASPGGWV